MSRVLLSELNVTPSKQNKTRKIPNLASMSKSYSNPIKKGTQKGHKQDTKRDTKNYYSQLFGVQKKIMDLVFFESSKMGERTTPPMTLDFIAETAKIPKGSVKESINRLVKKSFLFRENQKKGRGGWTQYRLSKEAYDAVFHAQMEEEKGHKRDTQKDTNGPSSSSSDLNYLNIAATTGNNKKSPVLAVEIPDSLRSAGFSENHLNQIERKFPEALPELQRSLEALAFDIERAGGAEAFRKQNGIRSGLIGWFFGSLKSGATRAATTGL